ncbi:MAG: hypothetical protein CEO22_52 [Candidatus Berkelbacteria bacterium Gr01-1014_85]|uniref:Transglycosylase SLT domain-containing protein n=1 Tax=Candidatus Berkelbacteria bacterium Gr01-1014_85 TaxID=2017150 RepID=A0A554JDN8_9BACT|nr:MAG: hypothetical protein CEO22_52 [Candidatus Berkelbacteria bacterium Gr01-1014_85]
MKLIGYLALGLAGILTIIGLAMAGALVGVGGSTPSYSGESFAKNDNGYETSYESGLAGGDIPRGSGRWQLNNLPEKEMKRIKYWKEDESRIAKMATLIQQMIDKYKLPGDQFLGMIFLESSWNPFALSSKGALGFSQFTATTAEEYVEFGAKKADRAKNRTDPFMSVQAMARKLSTDRASNNATYNKRNPTKPPLAIEWGTLEYAYRGLPGCPNFAYNCGVEISHWQILLKHAKRFRDNKNVFEIKLEVK